ncbi:MAG: hypothetical protein AAB456_03105 [Patescibacteria group bacterium]
MKKIFLIIFLLTLAGNAQAVPIALDDIGTTTQLLYNSRTDTFKVPFLMASSTTATSTFVGGLKSAAGIQFTGFISCNLDTDANGFIQCGTDAGAGVTVNTGTANRVAYYSATDAINSFNGLITGSDGTGSTTIASNLTVTSIFASSTVRITGALTLDTALTVANGGTGAISLTDGGILFGSGTGAITPSAVLANGELLIGDGTTDPTAATLTGTANELTVTNGAGSITLDIPDAVTLVTPTISGVATFNGATTLSTTTIQGFLNVGVLTATTSARLDDLTVTGTATFPASSISTLALTDGGTIGFTWVDAEVSDTLTASDLVAGSSVVSNAEVDNDLTISGGVIDGTIIGGTTAAAGTFTNLVATASSTFSTTARITAQGTLYIGGSIGIGTTTPTYGLTVGNPNAGALSASSSPLAQECTFTVTGTFTINMAQCVNSRVLAVGDVTLGFSNMRPGAAGSVTWCNDSTGARILTPDNTTMLFMNASSSGITRTANRCNLIGYKVSNATGTVKALMIPSDVF